MTRTTPTPSIAIEIKSFEDETTGQVLMHPVIHASSGAFNRGSISLDDMRDILSLRKTIDAFIKSHSAFFGQSDTNPGDADTTAPPYCDIVSGYLSAFSPRKITDTSNNTVTLRTSQEIVLDLADMVDMSINDVAECMTYLGYRTHMTPEKIGWVLWPVPPTM